MSRAIHPIISLLALVAWNCHAADHMPDARASMHLPLHVLAVEEMPESWRLFGAAHGSLSPLPWTGTEVGGGGARRHALPAETVP